MVIDKSSVWTVTGDSAVTSLSNAGKIVDTDGKTVRIKVPMVFCRSSRLPAPTSWAMRICPALVKPMQRAVVIHRTRVDRLTALRPEEPTTWPTTIMSTMP